MKLPAEAKMIEISPKFQRWMKKTNIFLSASHRKCILLSGTECHIINYLLTELARAVARTGEYWPSVVFLRTSLRSVRTVTTSGQYSPVRPSCSVSKRLIIITMIIINTKNQTFPGLNSSKPLPCTELMTKLQCLFCCCDTDITQKW